MRSFRKTLWAVLEKTHLPTDMTVVESQDSFSPKDRGPIDLKQFKQIYRMLSEW